MSAENLFKPSNRKDCRGVVLANILENVGISLDRSETYSHRVCLWQKNPQFGQSICFDTRRKQETWGKSREAKKVPAKSKDAGRLFCERTPDQNNTDISKREVPTCLPPFLLIRDCGKQNTRGNVSKISVSFSCYQQIGSKSTNHSH